MVTMWRRAVAAYLVWVLAHAIAGTVFALGTALFLPLEWWQLIIDGLFAGAVFGVAQWLALRPFFSDIRLWAPVTLVASPVSWWMGVWFATATLALGGWLGAGFSALAQTAVLALSFRRDEFLVAISLLWIPATVIGAAVFYFFYMFANATSLGPDDPPRWVLVFLGSVAYGQFTGLVVALLVVLAARRPVRAEAWSNPR